MDKNIQSSFIPKQVLTKESGARREPMGLFLLLCLVVLVIALLFFAGVYGYKLILTGEIERPCPSEVSPTSLKSCGLVASIEKKRQALNQQDLILKIERLDKQLKRMAVLLNGHKTFLPVFRLLEDETLQSIRYSSFSQNGAGLTLRGMARNYEGIALQSNVLSDLVESRRLTDFVFSDLNADNAGKVGFNLKVDLNPELLTYAATVIPPLP
ncbi:MAG: hypothetical protein AAB505_00585 [Patescibacteria group bacterium]